MLLRRLSAILFGLAALAALTDVPTSQSPVAAQQKAKADPTPPTPTPQPTGPTLTIASEIDLTSQTAPCLVVITPTTVDCDDVRWHVISPGVQPFPTEAGLKPALGTFVGFASANGAYKLGVTYAKSINGKAVLGPYTTVTVKVGNQTPIPPPTPTPNPPTPPTPPSPTDTAALIIIENAKDRTKLTQGQYDVMFDTSMRQLYQTKLPNGPDGMTTEFRIWDQGLDVSNDPSVACKKLFAMPKPTTLPWYRLSTGKALFEGPLTDVAGMQAVMANLK